MKKLSPIIIFMLLTMAGPSAKTQAEPADKPQSVIHYKKMRAVKNTATLEVTFYVEHKKIGGWPFHEADGGWWDKSKAKITGMTTIYNTKGAIIGKGLYLNGKKVGLWKEYSESGVLHGEFLYEKGNRKGRYKIYFESGALAEEGIFISGNATSWEKGRFKAFYPSGKLRLECVSAYTDGEGSDGEDGCKSYNADSSVKKMENIAGLDITP